jgi:hypothetical protein
METERDTLSDDDILTTGAGSTAGMPTPADDADDTDADADDADSDADADDPS